MGNHSSRPSSPAVASSPQGGTGPPPPVGTWQYGGGMAKGKKSKQIWHDYDATSAMLLEQAFHDGSTAPVSLDLGKHGGYTVDLGTMKQTSDDTGRTRPVRRRDPKLLTGAGAGAGAGASLGAIWEWEGDSNDTIAYDAKTSAILEAAFARGDTTVDLTHGFFGKQGGYTIDLVAMTQTKNATKFVRKVSRNATAGAGTSVSAPTPKRGRSKSKSRKKPAPKKAVSTPAPAAAANPGSGQWEWCDDTGTWHAFDAMGTRLLEGMLSRGLKTATLNHGEYAKSRGGYLVDFSALTRRENATKRLQEVRRNPAGTGIYGSAVVDVSAHNAALESKAEDKTDDENTDDSNSDPDNGKAVASSSDDDDRGGAYFGAKTQKEVAETEKLTKWKLLKRSEVDSEENCAVCLMPLNDEDDTDKEYQATPAVKLSRCTGHAFHRNCIVHCLKASHVTCPVCSVIYGVRVGLMPSGTMTISRAGKGNTPLSGYEKFGTITINYNFPSGTQVEGMPSPGKAYSGTSRTAYLPDNPEGNEVLRLLHLGFERKLLFVVGTSVTNGTSDTVVWGGIHHKTSQSGGSSSFGYPDETYFARVKGELEDKGVSVEDLDGRPKNPPSNTSV